MDPDNTPDMLPPLGLLSELDDSLRAKLARAGRFAAIPVGTRLATQGQPHQTLTVLLSGKAKVSCHAHGSYLELAPILGISPRLVHTLTRAKLIPSIRLGRCVRFNLDQVMAAIDRDLTIRARCR